MHIDAILGGLRTPFQIQIIDCVYQASLNVLGVSETSAKDAFKLTAALAPPPNAYDVIAYHVCHPLQSTRQSLVTQHCEAESPGSQCATRESVWTEFPDTTAPLKVIVAKPNKRSDGSDIYTVPVLSDSYTSTFITDYLKILFPTSTRHTLRLS